jgi:hypothetical protein
MRWKVYISSGQKSLASMLVSIVHDVEAFSSSDCLVMLYRSILGYSSRTPSDLCIHDVEIYLPIVHDVVVVFSSARALYFLPNASLVLWFFA